MKEQHLLAVEVDNVKRLVAARLEFDDAAKLVIIGGNNKQGKTSLLDAITMTLCGGRSVPADVVHDGADEGRSLVETTDLVIERKVYRDRPTKLKITGKGEFAGMKSGQALLDKMYSRLLDPLKFASATDKERVEMLRALLDQETIDALERAGWAENDAVEKRLDANREVARLEAVLDTMPKVEGSAEEQSAKELLEEIERASSAKRKYDEEVEARDREEKDIAALVERLEALKAEITGRMEAFRERPVPAPPEVDVEELHERLAKIEEHNAAARSVQKRVATAAELATAKEVANGYADAVTEARETLARITADAKMPVEGLAFDANQVTYNGHPWESCSWAESIDVSIAMALAGNPQLRVLLIRQGSALDEESLARVAQRATEYDCHVLVERAGHGDKGAIIIEDGEVAS